jgi:hypothetical protein
VRREGERGRRRVVIKMVGVVVDSGSNTSAGEEGGRPKHRPVMMILELMMTCSA